MNKKAEVSVIIITKNRPVELRAFLISLKKSTFVNFELIIVDQSKEKRIDKSLYKVLHKFPKTKYFHSKQSGKSRGLNLAIKLSSTSNLAFSDDDCLPDANWLKNVVETFEKNPKITGVFGRTLPYQPEKHKGLTCPSTFDRKIEHYVTAPCKHWEKIGFGNNMAWKKSFFEKYGLFKEWLGPGSIGSNAEDAEIALRALTNKQVLFFNPKMIVFHNKWLNNQEYQKQMLSYVCGEMACYGYLAKNNISLGKKVIANNFVSSKSRLLHVNNFADLRSLSKRLCFQIRGFFVGFFLN